MKLANQAKFDTMKMQSGVVSRSPNPSNSFVIAHLGTFSISHLNSNNLVIENSTGRNITMECTEDGGNRVTIF